MSCQHLYRCVLFLNALQATGESSFAVLRPLVQIGSMPYLSIMYTSFTAWKELLVEHGKNTCGTKDSDTLREIGKSAPCCCRTCLLNNVLLLLWYIYTMVCNEGWYLYSSVT